MGWHRGFVEGFGSCRGGQGHAANTRTSADVGHSSLAWPLAVDTGALSVFPSSSPSLTLTLYPLFFPSPPPPPSPGGEVWPAPPPHWGVLVSPRPLVPPQIVQSGPVVEPLDAPGRALVLLLADLHHSGHADASAARKAVFLALPVHSPSGRDEPSLDTPPARSAVIMCCQSRLSAATLVFPHGHPHPKSPSRQPPTFLSTPNQGS